MHLVTKFLKECCEQLNLQYKIKGKDTNESSIIITKNQKSIKFFQSLNNIYSSDIMNNCRNKNLTSIILYNNNIPVPSFEIFDKIENIDEIISFVKSIKIKYPLVIKPNTGSGGNHVICNIKTPYELKQILFKNYKNYTDKIIIEDYIEGTDYRVLCYNNVILDVLKRFKAHVKGNGKSTFKELVNQINLKRKVHNLEEVYIDSELLSKQNITENTIIRKNRKVVLNNNLCVSKGSVNKKVKISDIHPDNIMLFRKVNKALNLSLSGIDFIIKDITKSFTSQKCAINEVNSSPNFAGHYLAVNNVNVPMKFLKLYFEL
jgi:cyanophycin synthetase